MSGREQASRWKDARRRGFARLYDRIAAGHERLVEERKRALLGGLGGTIVELGPGTGANLRYYDPTARWIGIEPNPHMHPFLIERAREAGLHTEIQETGAETMRVDSGSADAVVSTLVLCSVADLQGVLRAVRRVLRPGGLFLFLEHVGAPRGTPLRLVQRCLRPAWSFLADGCEPDRDTHEALERAGFASVEAEAFRLPLHRAGPVAPHLAGRATT